MKTIWVVQYNDGTADVFDEDQGPPSWPYVDAFEAKKRIAELEARVGERESDVCVICGEPEWYGHDCRHELKSKLLARKDQRIAELEEALKIATHWLDDEVPPYVIRQLKEVLPGGDA